MRLEPAVLRPQASVAVLLWTLPVVYAMHVMEEFAFNWTAWANQQGLAFSWQDFALTNAAVIVFGIAAAAISERKPALSLAYPALMVLNGALFHLVPTVVQERLNPGCLTAVTLFLPLGSWVLVEARRSGVARADLFWAAVVAAVGQAFPLVLLALRSRLSW